LFVLAYTDPCAGMPLLEARRPHLHYVRFQDEQDRNRFSELLQTLPA
jgi:transketolase